MLDQAVEKELPVKIKTKDSQTFKFKKVVSDSGMYYGIRFDMKKRKYESVTLNTENILSINEKDRKNSTLSSILLLTLAFGGIYVIATELSKPLFSFSGGLSM
jgi:hypothetical protein